MSRFVIETLPLSDGLYEVQVWEGSSGEVLWRKLAMGLDELEVSRGEAWRAAKSMEVDPAWAQANRDDYYAMRERV